jgi:predicted DNA-binding protein
MKTVIPERMKTAVPLPDPLFKAADQLARQLGKSRSQLYAEALRDYLERHRDEDITRRLNEIYDAEPELAKLDRCWMRFSWRYCGRKRME